MSLDGRCVCGNSTRCGTAAEVRVAHYVRWALSQYDDKGDAATWLAVLCVNSAGASGRLIAHQREAYLRVRAMADEEADS